MDSEVLRQNVMQEKKKYTWEAMTHAIEELASS
jgi:hypothetical protein